MQNRRLHDGELRRYNVVTAATGGVEVERWTSADAWEAWLREAWTPRAGLFAPAFGTCPMSEQNFRWCKERHTLQKEVGTQIAPLRRTHLRPFP